MEFTKMNDTKAERRLTQARLAHSLRKKPARSGTSVFPLFVFPPEKLDMSEKPMELPQVLMVLPCGKQLSGTIVAHVNGFKFTAANGETVLMLANVRDFFLRPADEKCQPLMLLRLYNPLTVETIGTRHIQFRLLSDKDSDNIGGDKQLCCRNEDLINFAYEVQETQRARIRKSMGFQPSLAICQALEECEFDGVSPEGRSATYALTCNALVVLQPFTVYQLHDIEIVNLALTQSETIDMTVVFEDFERGVLEIRSIPSSFLTDIERRLNYAFVKYYVNKESKIKWKALVREIAESPEKFRELGGWLSLYLEDNFTLAYYASWTEDTLQWDSSVRSNPTEQDQINMMYTML